MTAKRVSQDGQPGHNNIEPGAHSSTASGRSEAARSRVLAQFGPEKEMPKKADDGPWSWPVDPNRYDRASTLTVSEEDLLTRYAEAYRFYQYGRTMDFGPSLDRLVQPLNDALDYTGIKTIHRKYVLLFFLREMAERKRSFWGWTVEEWIDSIERRRMERQHIVAMAYLLCGFADLHRLKCDHIVYGCLARKVFGREYMKTVSERVFALLLEWGYLKHGISDRVMRTVFEALLFIRSPQLSQLTLEHLKAVIARKPPRLGSYSIIAFSRVLASMGTVPEALEIHRPVPDKRASPALTQGVPPEWLRLCRLWFDRSMDANASRTKSFYFLLNVGRWLGHVHPTVLSPADWTRDLAAELVSVVCQWHGGDWCSIDPIHIKSRGKILARSQGIKAKEGESAAKLLTAHLRKAEESILGRSIVELAIMLSARTQPDGGKVLRAAAQTYNVNTDAVALKVKQEFAAKAKAKLSQKLGVKPAAATAKKTA